MAQAVTLMMASRPCWILGSGTVSQRMSFLPCQVSAFIDVSFGLHETQTPRRSSVPSSVRNTRYTCGLGIRPCKRRKPMSANRPFAIVTGASTGIGFELAKRCAREGYDLLIAADEPAIDQAAAWLRANGSKVEAVEADLATIEGVDKLYAAAGSRP